MWLLEFVDTLFLGQRLNSLGIHPRDLAGLPNILLAPFLHAGFTHLIANTVPFAVLGGIIIGLLENVAHFVDAEYLHWGNLYEIAPFYVLIIILMVKPYGLFGIKNIERV